MSPQVAGTGLPDSCARLRRSFGVHCGWVRGPDAIDEKRGRHTAPLTVCHDREVGADACRCRAEGEPTDGRSTRPAMGQRAERASRARQRERDSVLFVGRTACCRAATPSVVPQTQLASNQSPSSVAGQFRPTTVRCLSPVRPGRSGCATTGWHSHREGSSGSPRALRRCSGSGR